MLVGGQGRISLAQRDIAIGVRSHFGLSRCAVGTEQGMLRLMPAMRASGLYVLAAAVAVLAVLRLLAGQPGAAALFVVLALALLAARLLPRLSDWSGRDNADVLVSTLAFGAVTAACGFGVIRGLLSDQANGGRLLLMAVAASCLAIPTAAGIWVLASPDKPATETETEIDRPDR